MDSNNNLEYLVFKYLHEFTRKKGAFISSTIILYSKWIAVQVLMNFSKLFDKKKCRNFKGLQDEVDCRLNVT